MVARKKNSRLSQHFLFKTGIAALGFLLLFLVGSEIFDLAWGSGHWLGRLSFKWALTLTLYVLLGAGLFVTLLFSLYASNRLTSLKELLIEIRDRLGGWRWPLVVLMALFPAYFVFYSPLGALFTGVFLRLLIFMVSILVLAFLLSEKETQLVEWRGTLIAGLVIGALLTLAESFVLVSDYPFALHWSEGNRLWDYSVLFGRARYNYPADQPIFAWIDRGRQALWGLPFLIPNVSVWIVRLWGAILVTFPYALLAWMVFRPLKAARGQWLAIGLWSLIFLNQGPIYTPLIFSAILVAAARRRPLWLALPLVFLAGHYAGISRFSWRFAPGIWAILVTFGDAVLIHGQLRARDWLRAAALGLAGIWTKGVPVLWGIVSGLLPGLASNGVTPTPSIEGVPGATSVETLQGLQATATHQPFIWYRLLPNEIYPPGIVLGLAFAIFPLILLLMYLVRKGFWKTLFWQRIAIVAALLAFLAVGLVSSVKAGGGADLHNMDMFLVTLVLLGALAWEAGFYKRFPTLLRNSPYVRWLLTAMVFIPAFLPMIEGKPLKLPSEDRTRFVLERIQAFATCARLHGEVLFMDQRQLLTFGEIVDLPLVVDYEKKFVMDQALAGNEVYFEQFNSDLAAGRFSLIVTEREAILYKELDDASIGDSFVEENNAWVKWVTNPLLQHYESVGEYKDAAVELFMPIERNFVCP